MGVTWRRLLLSMSVCLVVGCSSEGPDTSPPSDGGTSGLAAILSGGLEESSQVPGPLRSTTWRLMIVKRGAGTEDVEALGSSLTFGVDGVSGKTCNSYGATLDTSTPDRITTDGFFSTEMQCEGLAGGLDHLVQQVLHGGATWHRRDATLTLARGGVTLAFRLQHA